LKYKLNVMKKIKFITPVLLLVVCNIHLQAQSNYFSLQTGYATGLAQQTSQNVDYNEQNDEYTYENVYMSYAEGIQLKLSYGHMFSDAFGVELGISQIFGKEHKSNYTLSFYEHTSSGKANLTVFNPSLVYSFTNKKLSPYAKFGLCGSVATLRTSTTNEWSSWSSETSESEYETTGKLNLGITSALGASLQLSKHFALLGEISFMSSTFNPKKSTITKDTYDGVDQLPDMTTRQKEVIYVNEVTYHNDQDIDDNKPSEELSYKLPMSNLTFSFGLKYTL
jgi:hypothetical protein